ncbi:secreted protein [Stagonosporopsis vannaccii]|nr:secreted protein [Stagonosporopsis vannaccii]
MKSTFLTIALATAVAALPQTLSTPPPSFNITNVVAGGTGCPQGSIDVRWTDDAILPIYFGKEFTAAVGPKAEIVDARKFCQLNLQVEYSAGFSFAVYSAEYAGFAELDGGITGTVGSRYYFSGETEQTSSSLVLTGPTKTKFKKQDDVPVALWSPCSGSTLFNVQASVTLTPLVGAGSGVLGIAKESGRLSEKLFVQWKKC